MHNVPPEVLAVFEEELPDESKKLGKTTLTNVFMYENDLNRTSFPEFVEYFKTL